MFFILLIGGLIGYGVGGFTGGMIGAALAYGLSQLARRAILQRGLAVIQSQFLNTTFAVMGALCKADGQVTRDEIQMAENLFDRLRLTGERREAAKAAFRRGRSADFDLDAEVSAFRQAARGQRALLQFFLQVQLSAIAADGQLHPGERDMLLRVARGLGLSEAEVRRLEATLQAGASGAASGVSSKQELENAYQVLGLDSGASDAEIKKSYRRLMSQNHPDKLAGKGLPDSMRELAEQRTREITTAYRRITEARQT